MFEFFLNAHHALAQLDLVDNPMTHTGIRLKAGPKARTPRIRRPGLRLAWLLLALLLVPMIATAETSGGTGDTEGMEIPAPLRAWIPWVLRDTDWRDCPLAPAQLAASGSEVLTTPDPDAPARRLCHWPGDLDLELDETGGRFAQTWRLYAPGWVALPGDNRRWPQETRVSGRPWPVLERGARPGVWLPAGEHALTGSFLWERLPDGLQLPALRARVHLRLGAAAVAQPRVDANGRLWLGSAPQADHREPSGAEEASDDALALDITRLLTDGVPPRLTTRLELEISGSARELKLMGAIPPGALPLAIDSPLPAQLEESGALRLQASPGHWVVQVSARYPGQPGEFALAGSEPPWPEREVWAVRADPGLRTIEVRGVPAVDPRQTRLPAQWQGFPAYALEPGDTLVFEHLAVTTPGQARLHLSRDLWLDFSGRGYSVRDRIGGELAGLSRLDARAPLHLGQVRIDGEPRLITRLPPLPDADAPPPDGQSAVGVEVRGTSLNLLADGRIESARQRLPASGWTQPFERMAATLYLPPGWDLLAVNGVDNLPPSWLASWSLLDLFLVLIAALACARLWGWHWGLLALATLTLIWQAPDAPRAIWLHLIAAAALLRVLPDHRTAPEPPRALRRARALVAFYARATLVVLVLIALPFLLVQMRDGLYPQIGISADAARTSRAQAPAAVIADSFGLAESEAPAPAPAVAAERLYAGNQASPAPRAKKLATDWNAPPPGAVLQTGAGVPDWTWNAFRLEWSGPVADDHALRLWLMPPFVGLLLACLQLLLVPALALRVSGWWPNLADAGQALAKRHGLVRALTPAAVLLAGVALLSPSATAAVADEGADPGSFPPAALLGELRAHLLTPPECWPDCLVLSRLHLRLRDAELHLLLMVAAGHDSALPLPGGESAWSARQVRLDGVELSLARRTEDGVLLVPLPAGLHRLELSGPLTSAERTELPLPLPPRLVTVEIDPDWQLEGLRPDGQTGSQLRLVPRATPAEPRTAATGGSSNALIPLLQLERDLHLGLAWELRSRLRRLSPAETSVSLWLPLLPGEAVTSDSAQVVENRLLLSLAPGQNHLDWTSRLAPSEQIALQASDDPRLVETWCIAVSPFWHLNTSGIDPTATSCGSARLAAELATPARLWRPWPGDRLELQLTRPLPVPGPTLTMDQSRYELRPGRRATEARLELTLRASTGAQHSIGLPPGAERLEVRIDGQVRGLVPRNGRIDLPLVPGLQRVEFLWQQPGGLGLDYRPPPVDVGSASVNANTEIRLGADRWILWTQGAGVGPAVLFWSLLVVLTLLAWGLAKPRLTPLRWLDWLLLGIGLSQADPWVALLVVGWLLALGWRQRLSTERMETMPAWRFNLAQCVLVAWTLLALLGLLAAIQQGLLGAPRMQIAGNGSNAELLRWYLDRAGHTLGEVWIVSVPMLAYRLLMLAWALWLALRLLAWLRWGWRAFASPLPWRPLPPRPPAKQEPLRLDI